MDHSSEALAIIQDVTSGFHTVGCVKGDEDDSPTWEERVNMFGFHVHTCWFSPPNRELDTFHCGDPRTSNHRRLCFCHEQITAFPSTLPSISFSPEKTTFSPERTGI